MAHRGSWFGLPDFGITEKISDIFGGERHPVTGGSQLTGGQLLSPGGFPRVSSTPQAIQPSNQQYQQPTPAPIGQAPADSGTKALVGMGLTGGDGGGNGGGGVPSIDWNAIFAPAFQAYEGYKQTLTGQQPGIQAGIEERGATQITGLEAEEAKRMRGFAGQEQRGRLEAGEARSDIQRQAAEMQTGIQSRFGGMTGTGRFASEILGSQAMRQAGKQQRALQYTVSEINRARSDLKDTVMTQIGTVNQRTDELKSEARREFQMTLERINVLTGELEVNKSQKRAEALNEYSARISEMRQQEQQFKQQLLTADAEGNAFLTAFQNQAYQEFQTQLHQLGASPLGEVQQAKTYTPSRARAKGFTEEELTDEEVLRNVVKEL